MKHKTFENFSVLEGKFKNSLLTFIIRGKDQARVNSLAN
jgi:hypothetical protein